MKLLKMVLLGALVPMVAYAAPPPDQTGGNAPDQGTSQDTSSMNQDTTSTQSGTGFGLKAKPMTAEQRSAKGGPNVSGLTVTAVDPGSPAEKAGVRVGDVLTKIDGNPVNSTDDLTKAYSQDQKGGKSHATLQIMRDQQKMNLKAAIESNSETQPNQQSTKQPSAGY